MTNKEFKDPRLKFNKVIVRPKYPEYKDKEFEIKSINFVEGIIEINEPDIFKLPENKIYNRKNIIIIRFEDYQFEEN